MTAFIDWPSSPMCKENYANIRGSRLRDSHEATVVRPVRSYYTFVPYLLYGAVQGCSCGFPQGSRVGYADNDRSVLRLSSSRHRSISFAGSLSLFRITI